MKLVATIIALAVLAAAGCIPTTSQTPSTVAFEPSARADVWRSVVARVAGKGYPITFADQASGAIATMAVPQAGTVMCGVTTCKFRQSLSVVVDTKGTITVNLNRELKGTLSKLGANDWYPPQTDAQIRDVMDAQTQLARELTAPI